MRRRGVIAIGAVALVSLVASVFTYRRYVIGRAPKEVCAVTGYGNQNVPERAYAVLDSFGMGMEDELVVEHDATLERDLAASGIFDLGGGCFAGWTPAVPSDEGAVHLWLVRDQVGHEFAWLTGHRHPRALDDAARAVRAAGKRAGPKRPTTPASCDVGRAGAWRVPEAPGAFAVLGGGSWGIWNETAFYPDGRVVVRLGGGPPRELHAAPDAVNRVQGILSANGVRALAPGCYATPPDAGVSGEDPIIELWLFDGLKANAFGFVRGQPAPRALVEAANVLHEVERSAVP